MSRLLTSLGFSFLLVTIVIPPIVSDAIARGGGGRGGGYRGGSHSGGGSHVTVRPHTRRDGTHVDGHRRTGPNSTQRDNFSSKPNVNPYSGKPGTKEPQR